MEEIQKDEEILEEDDLLEDEEELEPDQLEEEEPKSEPKKKQSKASNSFYAELRRKNAELEQKNKQLEVEVANSDFNTRKKMISSEVLEELDIQSIEDENDLILCEEYVKSVKKGEDNPILEANKALRRKIKADKEELMKQEKIELEQKKAVEEDRIKFKKKYGIETSEVTENEDFMSIFKDQISFGNLTSLYEIYLRMQDKLKKEENISKSMGVIPKTSTRASTNTTKSLNDLDGEDFLKAFKERYS